MTQSPFILPPVLDQAAASDFHPLCTQFLVSGNGAPPSIDGRTVTRLGTACAQMILALHRECATNGHPITLQVSDAFHAAWRTLGFDESLLQPE